MPHPRPAAKHSHARLPPLGEELAGQLARVAMRTLYAGVTRNETVLRKMKAAGKYTSPFEALTKVPVPKEVQEWIRANCWWDGEVYRALESEFGLALFHSAASRSDDPSEQFAVAPAKLRPMPEDAFDPEGTNVLRDTSSCCTPFCGPP